MRIFVKLCPTRHYNVVTTLLRRLFVRPSNVSGMPQNELLNDVSIERCQDASVVHFHELLLEHPNNVSKGRDNYVPSVRFSNVSNKSQMKQPTTSQWYITKTLQWYVSTRSHQHVSTTPPLSLKQNAQNRCCGTSPPCLGLMFSRRLVSRFLLHIQITLS